MLLRAPSDEVSPFAIADRVFLPVLGTGKAAVLEGWRDLRQPEVKQQAASIFRARRRCLHL